MASFRYFTGPMDCGKSTLALQIDHTHTAGGRRGRLFTSRDRAGEAIISSRLGLRRPGGGVDGTWPAGPATPSDPTAPVPPADPSAPAAPSARSSEAPTAVIGPEVRPGL